MDAFPRTMVGGVSLPRMIIGSNWFLGYSHTSAAKDKFIKDYQTPAQMADIMGVFLAHGIDAVMGPLSPKLEEACKLAEERSGKALIRILTPAFNLQPEGDPAQAPERMFDQCAAFHATFCMPHQCVTDALIDRMTGEIRHLERYTKMIRERGMIPGLSTHMPEAVRYADNQGADVESYIQIYNAAGFLMQVEVDWVMRVIQAARKPVMTIKPLAAGRLMPIVGLAYVWNTIRPIDMVTVGTTTADEARELIDISLDLLSHQAPDYELQTTRSKKSLN
jgi:hypothetical protein